LIQEPILEALRESHEMPNLIIQHRGLSKLIGTCNAVTGFRRSWLTIARYRSFYSCWKGIWCSYSDQLESVFLRHWKTLVIR